MVVAVPAGPSILVIDPSAVCAVPACAVALIPQSQIRCPAGAVSVSVALVVPVALAQNLFGTLFELDESELLMRQIQ